jgi:enamine deaminase RidA (YjgF/YER057c/UK114 family)
MPAPAVPKGSFVNFVVIDNMAYLSGHLPQPAEGALVVGKVGKDLSVEQGYEAAKFVGLNLCATLKSNIGDLDKVKRVVKLMGFVNCTDSFTQQPAVVNGCSDLMLKIFGSGKGAHTRSALGTNSLPLGVAVEVEAVFELEPNWKENLPSK